MLPMLGLKHLPRSDSLRRALYFSFPLVSMARPDILLQGKVPIKEVEKVRLNQLEFVWYYGSCCGLKKIIFKKILLVVVGLKK